MALSPVRAELAGEFVTKSSGGYDSAKVVCVGRELTRIPAGAGVIVDAGYRVITVEYQGGKGERGVYYIGPRQSVRIDLQPGAVYRIKGDYGTKDVQLSIVEEPSGKTLAVLPRVPMVEYRSGFIGRIPVPCDHPRGEDTRPARVSAEDRALLGLPAQDQAAIVFMNPGNEDRLIGHWFALNDLRPFRIDPNKYHVMALAPGRHELRTAMGGAVPSQSLLLAPGDVYFVLLRRQELLVRPGITVVGNTAVPTPETTMDYFWDFLPAQGAVALLREMFRVESAELVRR